MKWSECGKSLYWQSLDFVFINKSHKILIAQQDCCAIDFARSFAEANHAKRTYFK